MCVHFGAEQEEERGGGEGDEAESAFPILETISNPITEQEKAFFVSFYPRLRPPLPFLTPFHFVFEFQISMHPVELPPTPIPSPPQRESVLLSFFALGEEAEGCPELLDVPPSVSVPCTT